MTYKKDFIIVGSKNALTYKEIFPLLKENKMWLGNGFANGNAYFKVIEPALNYAKGVYDPATGLVKFRNCTWFTNLDIKKRHEDLILIKKYKPEAYPRYDNYEAINVDKVAEIPYDYEGVMGVPITFMDKYNPDQFEIIGSDFQVRNGLLDEIIREGWNGKLDRGYVNGERKYGRILIKNKHPEPRNED